VKTLNGRGANSDTCEESNSQCEFPIHVFPFSVGTS